MADTSGTTAYSYDDLYRLTGVTYPNNDVQSYTYDEIGNRLQKVHNGQSVSYTYDDLDEMTAVGGVTYTYDNNGNQVSAGSDTFTWDAADRLTSATISGVTSSFAYNGAGIRSSRTVAGNTVSYTWDLAADLPVVLQDSTGRSYVYGLDLISETDAGGNQTYFLYDGLGSTTGLTDGSKNVTGTYTYDAFGAVRSQTGATAEWSYAGEQTDPTGLQYLRARYYDPDTGRFISRDPLPLQQRYAYADNNPATLTDPTGLRAGDVKLEDIKYVSKVIGESLCWTKGGCAQLLAWAEDYLKRSAKRVQQAVQWCWGNTYCRTATVTAAVAGCTAATSGAGVIACNAAGSLVLGYEDAAACTAGGGWGACASAALSVSTRGRGGTVGPYAATFTGKVSKRSVIKAAGLPVRGSFHFIPPKRWNPTNGLKIVRGRSGEPGYVDRLGNVWRQGRSTGRSGDTFEWDVQLRNGTHINVSPRGYVTH